VVVPDARVVAIASNVVSVRTASRPEDLASDVQIVDVYVDGIWLQRPDDPAMLGIYADRENLPASWDAPTTIDDVIKRLSSAEAGWLASNVKVASCGDGDTRRPHAVAACGRSRLRRR